MTGPFTDDECLHGLLPETCSICKPKVPQTPQLLRTGPIQFRTGSQGSTTSQGPRIEPTGPLNRAEGIGTWVHYDCTVGGPYTEARYEMECTWCGEMIYEGDLIRLRED